MAPSLKQTYDLINLIKNKLEHFIANCSYSYNKHMIIATYQIIIAKGKV